MRSKVKSLIRVRNVVNDLYFKFRNYSFCLPLFFIIFDQGLIIILIGDVRVKHAGKEITSEEESKNIKNQKGLL